MKKLNKKTILLIALAVIMLASVGGTLAYLIDSTESVTNTFTPSTVTTEIVETFENNVKSSVQVKNTGDVDVYVRVAIVANWVKDGVVVEPATVSFTVGANWDHRNGTDEDGYYYYTKKVATGASTDDLLGSDITEPNRDDGADLEVVVIQQAIQAEPAEAVENVWPVTVNADGTLTVK